MDFDTYLLSCVSFSDCPLYYYYIAVVVDGGGDGCVYSIPDRSAYMAEVDFSAVNLEYKAAKLSV